jgi:hypothetical protein
MVTECSGGSKQRVNKGCLAVIDVGHKGNTSQFSFVGGGHDRLILSVGFHPTVGSGGF